MTIEAPSLLRAAALAAGAQHYPTGTLYIVATPIGNLADMSLRAIHVLALADVVACEDTRNSGALLRHLGLDKSLIALHAHNERQASQRLCALLAQGQRVAYVSDAGTPAVSDPGAWLVAMAAAAGHRVVPIPGASSALAALSVAGVAGYGVAAAAQGAELDGPVAPAEGDYGALGSGFRFVGFLPHKGGDRQRALARALAEHETQILFEAPHRMEALALALQAGAPQRRVTLCRELTKQFETVVTLSGQDLPGWLAADPMRLRGEFVVVLHGEAEPLPTEGDLPPDAARLLALLVRELPLKQAVALSAEFSGAPRNALYQAALALKEQAADDAA